MMKYAIGVGIGGNQASAVLVDLGNKKILTDTFTSQRIDNHASVNVILNKWAYVIKKTYGNLNWSEISGIGFAMPGPFDYVNGTALFTEDVAKFQNLFGINIREELRKILDLPEKFPIRFINDAVSFAVGEAWLGKAKNYTNNIVITLGTGFGSAFIKAGVPILSGDNIPNKGCMWHLQYREGIADEFFSTRWLFNQYFIKTGEKITGINEMIEIANSSPEILDIFKEFGVQLGLFLVPWIKKFGAECLIIGGSITSAYLLFGSYLQTILNMEGIQINILISELMEAASMVGCARLMDDQYWGNIQHLLSEM